MGAIGTNYGREGDFEKDEGAFVVAFNFRTVGARSARYEGANRAGASLGQTGFQTIFVNNSANDFDIILRNTAIGVEFRVMKGNQAFLPLFSPTNAVELEMRFADDVERTIAIPAALISKAIGPSVWRANSAIAN